MSLPSTLASTELVAINQILGAVGQAPVTTLDTVAPDVDMAYAVLTSVNRSTQTEGWHFNTELEYPMTPDVDGFIYIPDTMLQIDLSDLPENRSYDVTKRNGKLYNKFTHTDLWDTSLILKCDVVWFLELQDTPSAFSDYVASRAAAIYSAQVVSDANLFRMLKDREAATRAALLEYDCTQGDYSMYGFPNGKNYYYSYRPYQVISR